MGREAVVFRQREAGRFQRVADVFAQFIQGRAVERGVDHILLAIGEAPNTTDLARKRRTARGRVTHGEERFGALNRPEELDVPKQTQRQVQLLGCQATGNLKRLRSVRIGHETDNAAGGIALGRLGCFRPRLTARMTARLFPQLGKLVG